MAETEASVLQSPYVAYNCSKYYSYGYLRKPDGGDWLMWIADFCKAKLRIWCPFEA